MRICSTLTAASGRISIECDVPHPVMEMTCFHFREMSQTEITSAPSGLMYAHRAFELTTFRFGEVHHFGQPIIITPHYRDTVVIGLKRETLRL